MLISHIGTKTSHNSRQRPKDKASYHNTIMGYHNQSIKLITKMFGRSSSRSKQQNNKKNKNSNKVNFKSESLGGVYHVTDPLDDSFTTIGGLQCIIENSKSLDDSSRSLSTADLTCHDDSTTSSIQNSWQSSGEPEHEEGAPLLVRSAISSRNLMSGGGIAPDNLSDEEVMGRVMLRARKLPKANKYLVSNHVMINNERVKRTRVPLKRNPSLDAIAQQHAKGMAVTGKLIHPDLDNMPTGTCKRLGANVGCGSDIRDIHTTMTTGSQSDLNNIIDRRFVYMGVGTAKGSDGKMYLCQIFGD